MAEQFDWTDTIVAEHLALTWLQAEAWVVRDTALIRVAASLAPVAPPEALRSDQPCRGRSQWVTPRAALLHMLIDEDGTPVRVRQHDVGRAHAGCFGLGFDGRHAP